MKEKLKKYFERMPLIITCAAALNPCFNVQRVEFLIESISTDLNFFDDSYATKAKNGSPTRSKANETMFSVLSRMAMDILSVQANSVASKSAFSTSGRVLSIRITRLTPASLEMYFEEEILNVEMQANEAIPLSDEEIALDAASSEGSKSGPGSEGAEAEAEANYGYDVYHGD
nr:zinc finger BED domain-containing protein DAYSLEEPER-like [Tanacetum cinerariifolium]